MSTGFMEHMSSLIFIGSGLTASETQANNSSKTVDVYSSLGTGSEPADPVWCASMNRTFELSEMDKCPSTTIPGGKEPNDPHGCKTGSTGMRWCPEANKCVAPWLEPAGSPCGLPKKVHYVGKPDKHGCYPAKGEEWCSTANKCADPKDCPPAPKCSPNESWCAEEKKCKLWGEQCGKAPDDPHGCKTGSTGLRWCPEANKCVAPWLEPAGSPCGLPKKVHFVGKPDKHGCYPSEGEEWCSTANKCTHPKDCPPPTKCSPNESLVRRGEKVQAVG